MPNMLDYLAAYGGVPLAQAPWRPLDSLLCANLCYNDLGPLARSSVGIELRVLSPQLDLSAYAGLPYSALRETLLRAMADSPRFGGMRACRYVNIIDNARPIQFSAVTLHAEGLNVIAYRGTDNTLTGWREDLYMSFESPVPAQEEAVRYLESAARSLQGPLLLTGHSKGGNLAAYAAAHASPPVQARILWIDCFDSPGLDDSTLASPGYARVRSRMRGFIPQGSVVGLLMGYADGLTIVRSTGVGLLQHDSFTWQVEGDRLMLAPRTTLPSQLMDRTLHIWLTQCTPEQRRVCVDALFDLMDAASADTLSALKADPVRSAARILGAAREMDSQTFRVFWHLVVTLLQSGAEGVMDMASESQMAEQLRAVAQSFSTDQWRALQGPLSAEQVKRLLLQAPETAQKHLAAATKIWQKIQAQRRNAPGGENDSLQGGEKS